MTRTIVVGDVHGQWWLLDGLLRSVGAVDEKGGRNPGWLIAQVGDLIHCGADTLQDDMDTLLYVRRLGIDYVAIGNHELPFVAVAGLPTCGNAWDPRPETLHMLRAMFHGGTYLPAFVVKDGWVVTHAGIHPRHFQQGLVFDEWELPAAIQARFQKRLLSLTFDPLFDAVDCWREDFGPTVGGIFWADWRPINKMWTKPARHGQPVIRQIVGHTPRRKGYAAVRRNDGDPVIWCVDGTGINNPRISAVVDDGEGTPFRPVVFRGSPRP